MANPLTGDFEAVVQVSLRQINGLLAALHQNGLTSTAPLKLLHNAEIRVGAVRPKPDVGAFGDWVHEFQLARGGQPSRDLRPHLVDAAAPGVARLMKDAFAGFDHVLEIPPTVVKGTARIQVSTVRLSIAEGSTSEVTVHADVRADYAPQAGTTALPEPIHGEVRAAFTVRRMRRLSSAVLVIRPSEDDQKILFVPAVGSGLSAPEAAVIAAEIRKVLRDGFELLPVELPAGFPFGEFKGLSGGATAAVALPVRLSGVGAPQGNMASLTQSFIGPSGFGIAVSGDHVRSLIDVEQIREAIRQRTITFTIDLIFGSASATYRLRFSSGPTLTLQQGAIEIAGRVEAETSAAWAPNGFVSFKQRVTLVLDVATQRVDLEPAGEPDVDESWFIPHSRAVNIVKSEVARAISQNEPAVRQVFADAKSSLVTGLRSFETTAAARYTQLQISPDDVVIRGQISSAPRMAPVVQVAESSDGQVLTAFESWIPGGRIDRFVWSWVELDSQLPVVWGGTARSETVAHRFEFPKPSGHLDLGRVCLRLEGTRIRPDGSDEAVVAGTTCAVREPELTMDFPAWWLSLSLPVWQPDIPLDGVLRDGVAAHLSVQTDRPGRDRGQNTLVFFPDWRSARPFDELGAALKAVRRQRLALGIVAVLPVGAFEARRRELDAKLSALPAPYAGRVQITEDIDGGWTKTFDAGSVPAAFLIDARRECTWKSTPPLAPEALAAALDTHVLPAPGPRFRPLQAKVSVGEAAPDVRFSDQDGDEAALHRLRGQRALFAFWQAWSGPCLEELRRLQQRQAREPDLRIVAFHGGALDANVDEIRKQFGLTYPIVIDTEHRAARAFGVRCWPTIVVIDAAGAVEHIQVGLEPSPPRRPAGE